MIDLSPEEAILMRLLAGFFGQDRVILRMSVLAVCGGELPANIVAILDGRGAGGLKVDQWAAENKCLFTIVDDDDNPRMVVEFFSGYQQAIDVVEFEHQTYLAPILEAAGIKYVTMTNHEFSEIVDPQASLDFFSFLNAKVNEQLSN